MTKSNPKKVVRKVKAFAVMNMDFFEPCIEITKKRETLASAIYVGRSAKSNAREYLRRNFGEKMKDAIKDFKLKIVPVTIVYELPSK